MKTTPPCAYITNYNKLKEMFPTGNLHMCHSEILLELDSMLQMYPDFTPCALAVPYRRNSYAMFDLNKREGHRFYYTFKDIAF